jgi:uncharacterized OsmC-like protein
MGKASSKSHVNGIELDVLRETIGAIQNDPELAKCHFRAHNTWMQGNHNRSEITNFYGAKQEMSHKQRFELDADEPPILAGEDSGANPVEHLLHALASCVTTSMVAHAAVRGIEIRSLESQLEGDIDLRGFLGLDPDVPKGYTNVRINFKVDTDPGNIEQLRKLAAFSPVYNTLINGTNVEIKVEPTNTQA